jgi:hypothetical protein
LELRAGALEWRTGAKRRLRKKRSWRTKYVLTERDDSFVAVARAKRQEVR